MTNKPHTSDISRALEDGWIKHDGGPCPVPLDSWVRMRFRDYRSLVRQASWAIWEHDSSLLEKRDEIIAYKPEPKP